MIRALLALLFERRLTEAEQRFLFYFGHDEAKRWHKIIAPAASERMNFWSRHGL